MWVARLHRKIRRSKKLTRLLLAPSALLRLASQSTLSQAAKVFTLVPASPIPAPPTLKCIGPRLSEFDMPQDPTQFPAIQVIRTGPAEVFGHSHFVRTPHGQLIHHDLFNPATHKASEEDHRRLHMQPSLHAAQVIGAPLHTSTLPAAALFTDAVASNYAHWLTEVLPRIVLYTRNACSKGMPLIVDAGLHPNIFESLSLAIDPDRVVYTLPQDCRAIVKQLDLVTPAGYVPYAPREPRGPGHSHGVFSTQALRAVRDTYKQLMARPDAANKRLYVRRNSGLRKLVNDADISRLLSAAGFTIVAPEELSFSEQVRLFSQAELVIGATGAALANLIFCPPGARVHVLMAQHQDMPYWYWQRLADCVGVDLSYGLGNICAAPEKGFHADFEVAPSTIESVLDELRDTLVAPQRTAS